VSEIADAATAFLLLGDHAAVDAAGKVNFLGAGWTITQIVQTGLTAPHSVLVMIDVPSKFYGDSVPVSLSLLDDTRQPVEPPGNPPIRMAQLAKIERPQMQGVALPQDLPARIQILMGFPMGLPLERGRKYTWQLEIDSTTKPDWETWFYVVGPPPQPVIG
jgi:hypothetical protein